MILWDRNTDTFTRGQWLCKKQIWPGGSSISSDGEFFKYHYEVFTPVYEAYMVTSKVLNFTAITGGFKKADCGRWVCDTFENVKPGPGIPPEGYSFVGGAILKNGEVIADFSNDIFVNIPPIN